ncbi:MAG: phosphoglycerate kinase [Deltaproteobacteria bacterium]|nr:phosphoglycerate kinase [Deltaproteobacteria bacterium]
MAKLTVDRLDAKDKKVLVRVDFNVPLDGDRITDDTRIRAGLPTIQHLVKQGARVILASHLGRPKGKPEPKYSLAPVAKRLGELLGKPVAFCSTVIDNSAKDAVGRMKGGDVLLLENVRFHAEEEKNDPAFAKSLASLADLYVSDAFGTVHRAHASTAGVAQFFPKAAAGFLIAKELEFLGMALNAPKSPYVAIVGGAKVGDKITILRSLLDRADTILVGGGMAYTFLKTMGHTIGTSLLDEPNLGTAEDLLKEAKKRGKQILLPTDHKVAAKFSADSKAELCAIDIADGMMGLDIGPKTIARYTQEIGKANMIVWNGPMGVFEFPAFQEGTFAVAKAVAESKGVTIVGGGDSVAAANQAGYADRISHISTGGGASLEFLEGKNLPGIAVLSEA